MNLQKKEFNMGYDKTAFYSIVGEYFAEKKYREEMPYLVNSEEKEWRLFFNEDKLAGFYGHEEKKGQTFVSGVYVLSEYRHSEVCAVMLEDMLLSFSSIRMTSSNPRLITLLRKNNFRELSRRGSYITLECTHTGNALPQTQACMSIAKNYPQKYMQEDPEWISTT